MSNNGNKLATFVTPKGVAHYPHLNSPDDFMGKKKFKSDLLVDPSDSDVKAFMAMIEEIAEGVLETAKENTKNPKTRKSLQLYVPWDAHYDSEGVETSLIKLKVACNAEYTYDGTLHKVNLRFFDAVGDQVKNPEAIWGGSVLRTQGQIVPFGPDSAGRCGVSLRLNAVQIIELISGNSGGGASGESFGFTKEDGYVQPSFAGVAEGAVSGSEDEGDY